VPRILRRDDRENAFKNGNALFFTVPRQTAKLSWLSEVGVPSSVEDIGLSEKINFGRRATTSSGFCSGNERNLRIGYPSKLEGHQLCSEVLVKIFRLSPGARHIMPSCGYALSLRRQLDCHPGQPTHKRQNVCLSRERRVCEKLHAPRMEQPTRSSAECESECALRES